MNRRRFLQTATQAGAALGLTGWAAGAGQRQTAAGSKPAREPTLRDIGWVWEGQGIDPEVPPNADSGCVFYAAFKSY